MFFLFQGSVCFWAHNLRDSSVLHVFRKRGFCLFDVLFDVFCSTCSRMCFWYWSFTVTFGDGFVGTCVFLCLFIFVV